MVVASLMVVPGHRPLRYLSRPVALPRGAGIPPVKHREKMVVTSLAVVTLQ